MNAARDTETHADCWAPLQLRAELVRAGDILIRKDGDLRMVQWVSMHPGHDAPDGKVKIMTQFGIYAAESVNVRADYPVNILVPHAERAARLELRRQLGAEQTPGSTT